MIARALAALALLVAATPACSFERRSQAFSCQPGDDCGSGKSCVSGWCVDGDGGGVVADADPNAPDSAADGAEGCPLQCSVCEGNLCIVTCAAPDSCATEVVCPAGMLCKVECNGDRSCGGGIDCQGSITSCKVECMGTDSCDGLIRCGNPTTTCNVECVAGGTCTGGIECGDACSCLVGCTGANSCTTPAVCPEGCTSGDGCKNMGGGCMCGA
jgi:hypothetical protein